MDTVSTVSGVVANTLPACQIPYPPPPPVLLTQLQCSVRTGARNKVFFWAVRTLQSALHTGNKGFQGYSCKTISQTLTGLRL